MGAILDYAESSNPKAASLPKRCRICGGNSGRVFSANGFAWFRCQLCHTTQKMLTRQGYQELNPSYDPGKFLDLCNREQIEEFLNIRGATKVLADVVDEYFGNAAANEPRRSFLDVGSGMGMYLIAAQRLGFDVLGFEPSMDHARVATECFHLPVVNDYFSADRVAGKRFDLIVLSHVIEHIYEPKTFVHELVEVLKPGGALIVITPNNDSLVARLIGKAWPMLKPIDHVSMICANAYDHFDLAAIADVHHSTSEFPFEFAASALAAAKGFMSSSRRGRSSHQSRTAEDVTPPLRGGGAKANLLRYGLSALSAPMHILAIATRRQACLKSIVVRRV